jgi:hypothetical protein
LRDCRYPRRLAPEPRRRHRRPRPEHYNGIVDRHTHDGEEVLAEPAPHGWGRVLLTPARSPPRFGDAVVGAHQVMKGDLGRIAPWRRGTQVEMARQRRIGAAADFGPRRESNTVRQNARDPHTQHARGWVSLSRQRPVHTSERPHPAIWGGSGPHARLRTSALVMLQTTAEGLRKRYRAPPATWWFHPRAGV